ncbi:hypothetical protein B0T10DRAFT_533574 [Thelonectria olida]|uniref:Uncharacterized protein n=1 Tax=Thelonectria olida TaxID=1576542 RepID=A0A9P8VR88_9HYPO|nr:hypothetical protein B0T10DRAFT_533574 [Thelonectria olida]
MCAIGRERVYAISFALPPPLTISAPEFRKLRQAASVAGASAQYYGYTIPTPSAELPKNKKYNIPGPLVGLATEEPLSLTFEFPDAQFADFVKALEAPVCEFACIRLSDSAPLSDSALQASMHKTYADTYKIERFAGVYWAYATNTNDSSGEPLSVTTDKSIPEGQRRLRHHQKATETKEFAEELTKLMPYFSPGTGA